MKKYLLILLSTFLLFSCSKKSNIDQQINQSVDSVLRLMTIDEKIGQMVLYSSDWDVTGSTIKKGFIDEIRKGN